MGELRLVCLVVVEGAQPLLVLLDERARLVFHEGDELFAPPVENLELLERILRQLNRVLNFNVRCFSVDIECGYAALRQDELEFVAPAEQGHRQSALLAANLLLPHEHLALVLGHVHPPKLQRKFLLDALVSDAAEVVCAPLLIRLD